MQSGHQVTKGRHQFINEEEEEERTEETCQQNASNIPGEEGHMWFQQPFYGYLDLDIYIRY